MNKVRERTVGSGITRHVDRHLVIDEPCSDADVQAIKRALSTAAQRNTPWAWLKRQERVAARTLEAIEAGEVGEDADRIFEPHHGSGWYAREILGRVRRIESARRDGDFEAVARASGELSELATVIRLKCAWDKDVETGLAVASGGEASRKGRSADERILAIRTLCSNDVPIGKAIATIAAEDRVTVQAVEKQYYKKRPTGVSRDRPPV